MHSWNYKVHSELLALQVSSALFAFFCKALFAHTLYLAICNVFREKKERFATYANAQTEFKSINNIQGRINRKSTLGCQIILK